ncbi:hypothetical protein BRD17_00225 [Halobacteriales archaeon SW_7_68_16]|nr:MAG: hypothetical protein BRD17_00225 [Halobacteriales archaeon SW_7_68_16]
MESVLPRLVAQQPGDRSIVDRLVDELQRIALDVTPRLVQAIVVLLVGYAVAAWLGGRGYDLAYRFRFDERLTGTPIDLATRSDPEAIPRAIGQIVKYVVLLLALVIALTVLDVSAIERLNATLVDYAPLVLAAAIVVVVGTLISTAVGRAVTAILAGRGYGDLLDRSMLGAPGENDDEPEEGPDRVARLGGLIVEVYGYLVTLTVAAGVLRLPTVEGLFRSAVAYVPALVFGLVLLGLGTVIARMAGRRVADSATAAALPVDGVLDEITTALLVAVSGVVALSVLGVSDRLLATIVLVVGVPLGIAVALAVGLSVGVGAQDYVRDLIRE